MNATMQQVCPLQEQCKCCGAAAYLYGVVDFHKHCDPTGSQALPLSGVPIYYYRCADCLFLFATAFDRFTAQDFRHYIYNEEYLLIDPEYLGDRPRADARSMFSIFPGQKPQRVLDYGGGTGIFADTLRTTAFAHADTYDPFSARFSEKPAHRYDCVVSFQVMEHAINPAQSFAEISDLLEDPGIAMVTTLLQPADIDKEGLKWWYAGPRNGHVSLYSKESLARVVRPFGFKVHSLDDNSHLLFRQIPDFARHLVPGSEAKS